MATQKYIKINGALVNFSRATGDSVEMQFSSSTPDAAQFTIRQPYTSTIPTVGQNVQIFDRADNLLFAGTIDEVDWEGLQDWGSYLTIPIKAVGYNNRLFIRTTFARIDYPGALYPVKAGTCAKYASYQGHVNTQDVGPNTLCTYVDGDKFSKDLTGKTIRLNGTNAVVLGVSDPDRLTVAGNNGVHAGWTYDFLVYSGDIVKDLLDNFCDFEGFTYDVGGTTISQGALVTRAVFDPAVPVNDAIQTILKSNPTFYFAVNPAQVCYFGARTLVAAPGDFTDASGKWKSKVANAETREDVRNSEISITSWDAVDPTSEAFVGDGVSKAWFVAHDVAQMVKVQLNGVDVSFASSDQVGALADYFFRVDDRAVWQDPAGVTLTGADTLTIIYKRYGDQLLQYTDTAAAAARAAVEGSGLGMYEEVVDRTDLSGKTPALAVSTDSVNRLKDNFQKITIITKEIGYRVGQSLTVNIADRATGNVAMFIDQVSASDSGILAQASAPDFFFTLTCVSITRRITGVDVLRTLFDNPGGGGGGTSFVVSGGGSATSNITDLTLAGPTTVNSPHMPTDGEQWFVRLKQDATGGRVVTWGANVLVAPIIAGGVNSDPNTMCVVSFVGLGGNWYCYSAILGVPNA